MHMHGWVHRRGLFTACVRVVLREVLRVGGCVGAHLWWLGAPCLQVARARVG